MNDIELKKATSDDWEIVSDLEKNAASKTFHPTVTKEDETRNFINDNELFFIVAEGKEVGIIAYEDRGDHFYICEFIIDSNYQGKGYGKKALEILLEKIGNAKPASLYTHPENTPAITVYLKAGFKINGWKDNYFGDGEPRLLLVKE